MKKQQFGSYGCLIMALILSSKIAEAGQNVAAPQLAANVKLELAISGEQLNQFSLPISTESLRKQIISNLAEWGYPFPTNAPFSHRIEASLGKIGKQQTPVGFSFTLGSSDPRSTDFQKALVLPISCRIQEGSSDIAIKNQTASAKPFTEASDPTKLEKSLADEISSVCLEVLEQAPLPKAVTNTSESKTLHPKWLPNIQIEIKEPAASLTTPSPSAQTTQSLPLSTQTTNSTVPIQEDNQQAVKKQIIINNQGSPLILEFGHERR